MIRIENLYFRMCFHLILYLEFSGLFYYSVIKFLWPLIRSLLFALSCVSEIYIITLWRACQQLFLFFCFFWSVMFTFKESHTRQTVKSFSKMPFYQTMHNRMSAKKAKPALCFARIANAILGEVTLHNSSFLSIKKAQKKHSRNLYCVNGERGIWTLAPLLTTYSLSRGAPSASWVFLQILSGQKTIRRNMNIHILYNELLIESDSYPS